MSSNVGFDGPLVTVLHKTSQLAGRLNSSASYLHFFIEVEVLGGEFRQYTVECVKVRHRYICLLHPHVEQLRNEDDFRGA